MSVDKLYLENIEEFVYDDKAYVTYKYLSCKLCVHVNLAKQMLFEFYKAQKAKGREIFATFYISGIAPQKWISSINSNVSQSQDEMGSQDSEGSEDQDSFYDQDALLVLLCKDSELEDFKKKFTQLFSVHIYALSSSPMKDFESFNQAVSRVIKDDEGHAPVHYGPITCKAAFELHENPRFAPLLQNIREVKATVEKQKEQYEKEKQMKAEDAAKLKTTNAQTGKDKDSNVHEHGGKKNSDAKKDRLKNMFAAAASKPKPKAEEKPVPKKEEVKSKAEETSVKTSNDNTSTKTYSRGKNEKTYGKQKPNVKAQEQEKNRKRKRIRDVFSSSDDENSDKDVKKMSDNDDEDLPESPIPRKAIQLDSDSDDELSESLIPRKVIEPDSDSDDDFKETPKKVRPPPSKVVEQVSSGKRRVSKFIPKRHVDDEGFLVTVMEQVMVSESDHSEEETEDKINKKPVPKEEAEPVNKNKGSIATTSKSNDKPKASKPFKAPAPAAGKTKQASIMSFFKKT